MHRAGKKKGSIIMACTTTKTGKLTIDQNVPNDCGNYWENANIKLVGGVDEATAKVGVPSTITVQVFNVSSSPISNVHVEAWVCDYTMGVSSASSLTSSNPSGFPMTGEVNMIGAGASAVISCLSVDPNPPHNPRPWTPTAADAALNGGHVCIAANCYGDQPDDGGASGGIFNFCCDAHHAQRNINVSAMTMKMIREGGLDFDFFAANPDPEEPLEAIVQVKKVTGRAAFGLNERQLLLSGPYAKASHGRLGLVLAGTGDRDHKEDEDHEDDEDHGTPLFLSRLNPTHLSLEGPAIGQGNGLKLSLPPGGRTPLKLRVRFNPKEKPGAVYCFDTTQTDMKGDVVGGVRTLALVTS
jgi:hypothetical protein